MIKIERYTAKSKNCWNEFVLDAKNGHFMFCRDYMDYHAERFDDHSLMFFENEKLMAVLPADLLDNVLYSHRGLTFGGIISNNSMKTPIMLNIVDKLIEYLRSIQVRKLIYKNIPYIYYTLPAQEDLYALYNKGAALCRVDISSTIELDCKLNFSKGRKEGIKKALKNEVQVRKSEDYENFHKILTQTLANHDAIPTHSLLELKLLAGKFPQNISLYSAVNKQSIFLAGVIVFEMNHWVHIQYISCSHEGKAVGALDLLFHELINLIYPNKKFFDFGISTESQGRILNNGLIEQKEWFGARAVIHNFFELNI